MHLLVGQHILLIDLHLPLILNLIHFIEKNIILYFKDFHHHIIAFTVF